MAQRRMFSLQIVDTDAFLDMPGSAQLLYFHLAMRADDDGFVGNTKKIMRMVGSADDDFKILLVKNFVIPFQSGVCVIKHWRIHNLIRGDRYNETKYVDEKEQIELKENGAYTMATTGIPTGNQMAPQVRLGKDSIGKDREETSLSFLENLPETVRMQLSEKYHISPKGIQSKATDLLLYCRQKGKVYKDYKSFLENALRKDKAKLQADFPLVVKQHSHEEVELTPEQIEKNRVIRENITNMLKKKSQQT